MKEFICVWCHPETPDDEDDDHHGLCKEHMITFLEELERDGHKFDPDHKSPFGHLTNEEIGSGPCMICTKICTSKSFCYGCGEFICASCVDNNETLVIGKHKANDHLVGLKLEATN